MFLPCFSKIILCLKIPFTAKRKCTPVNSDWLTTLELFVNYHRFLWISVLRFEDYPWLVGSNWKDSQVERTKHTAYLFENLAVSCITWVKYFLFERSLKNKPSPKSSIEVVYSSFRPVTDRNKSYFILPSTTLNINCLHPIHSLYVGFIWHDILWSFSSYKQRFKIFI